MKLNVELFCVHFTHHTQFSSRWTLKVLLLHIFKAIVAIVELSTSPWIFHMCNMQSHICSPLQFVCLSADDKLLHSRDFELHHPFSTVFFCNFYYGESTRWTLTKFFVDAQCNKWRTLSCALQTAHEHKIPGDVGCRAGFVNLSFNHLSLAEARKNFTSFSCFANFLILLHSWNNLFFIK